MATEKTFFGWQAKFLDITENHWLPSESLPFHTPHGRQTLELQFVRICEKPVV